MNKYVWYVLSPLFYFGVATAGRLFTSQGIPEWYAMIEKPSFTPPGSVIGVVWTVIYVLTCISLIVVMTSVRDKKTAWIIALVYVINGVLNAAWSYIFFTAHNIGMAVAEAILIAVTVAFMMILDWPHSRASALLLVPYLLWVSFASFLTYSIYRIN